MKTIRLIMIASALSLLLAGCAKTEDVEKIQSQIDKLKNEKIKSVEEQVSGIRTSLGNLETTSTELKGFIETLQGQVTALETADTELSKAIADLKTEMSGDITAAQAECLAELEAYRTTLNTELTSIRSAIASLQGKDTDLQTQITSLRTYVDGGYQTAKDWASATFATLEAYNTTAELVASLQTQVQSIAQDVATLKNRVFEVTLVDLRTAISGLKGDIQSQLLQIAEDSASALGEAAAGITSAYTGALSNAMATSESSLKTWVNEQLTGYYKVASLDAELTSIQQSIVGQLATQKTYLESLISTLSSSVNGSEEQLGRMKTALDNLAQVTATNAADIATLRSGLASTKTELTQAYTEAISTAINTLDGRISGEIAASVNDINTRLDSWIQGANASVAALAPRVTAVEADVAALQEEIAGVRSDLAKLLGRIQSIAVIPTYSDGSVTVNSTGIASVDIEVMPLNVAQALVTAGKSVFGVKAVYTGDGRFVDLPVENISFDGEAITLTFSGTDLDGGFLLGTTDVSARVSISDGNSERASEYFLLNPTAPADLSAAGTSNCYIITAPGAYSFDATVKGGGSEPVGVPASAEVLWESFGTGTAPNVGDIVKPASFVDGKVVFATPSTLADGNAVVAVKDASGNILWSWHIWVCEGFNPDASAQSYNNDMGIVMDRNLGATSAAPGDVEADGLLYQWGRKDPFPGAVTHAVNPARAASTIDWPVPVQSDASVGTIGYSVAHPTTFITPNSTNEDWDYAGTGSRWQSAKTDYDPCPRGWRVPDGGPNSLWKMSLRTGTYWSTASNWNSQKYGMPNLI